MGTWALLAVVFLLSLVLGNSVCGWSTVVAHIASGREANAGQWPWQVSVHQGWLHVRSATLIPAQWVLNSCVLCPALGSYTCSSSKEKDPQPVCGQLAYSGRIMGGQDAAEGRWPWQVGLYFGLTPVCGGCLISDRWILTAAHCIQMNWMPWFYTVSLGSVKVSSANYVTKHHVSKIIFHPKSYDTTADIALLKLVNKVTFTSSILPICLPNITKQLNTPGSCWVTGWGKVNENEETDYSPTLQEVEVPIIDRQTCESMYGSISLLLPNLEPTVKKDMLCAGDVHKKLDTCKGDSGGPLSCYIDGSWTVIGLVSWGFRCGESLPGVYTNVTYYQKWIEAIISRADVWGPTIWTYLTFCSLFYCSLWLFYDPPGPWV